MTRSVFRRPLARMNVRARASAMRSAMRSARWAAVAGVCSVALASRVAAQPKGEGPLVLRLPASARFAAMANAAIASNDADALLYNPGMLSVARGMSASVQRYGAFGTAGSIATVTQAGIMSVGVGAQFLEWSAPTGQRYDDAVRKGATQFADSGGLASASSAFTVGVARTVKGLRLGVSGKYADERFGGAHGGAFAVDIGMTRPMGPGNLGLLVQNLGAGAKVGGTKGVLPRRVGIGYGGGLFPMWERWDLGAQMQLTLEGDLFVRPAGGVELGYVPIEGVSIVFRSGLRLPRERDESLVTGGLGVTIDRLSLDYAAEPFRGGRPVSHRIGIRVK